MAYAGQVLESADGSERVVFRRTAAATGGRLLELDFALAPGESVLGEHRHPRQEEAFEILEGVLSFRLDGRRLHAGAGTRVVVPAGTAHFVWNEGRGTAAARVTFRPALDTEGLFELLFALGREGRTVAGRPSPLRLASRLSAHPDEIELSVLPRGLQRALVRILAPAGALLERFRPVFGRPAGGKTEDVDRETSKHGPRVDDELARESESIERGAPVEAHVEEEQEREGPGERDRDVDARTGPAASLGSDPVEARRELSRHLRLTAFPGDRDALVAEARENRAPAPVVETLERLPAGMTFATVHEAWVALGEAGAAADRERLRDRTATEPLNEADR